MRKNKIAVLALLACMSLPGFAQDTDGSITGFVVDKWGQPVYGASVRVAGDPDSRVETDKNGKFEIFAEKDQTLEVFSIDRGNQTVTVETGKPMTIVMGYAEETVDIGADRTFSRSETTASISTVYNAEFNKRSSKNVSNSLIGQGQGMVAIQNAGNYASANPTFYVRGLQSLSSNSPLVLVDGIERDMNLVSPEEVESVSILKDAAAVALYGYKGINGAILITTKRGKYNSREINFTYDHVTNFMTRKPEFADAYTYANAMNEARKNDKLSPRYLPEEVEAFRTGKYPYLYPNVNWMDETFRNSGVSNKYNIEFRGGGSKFRYYTMIDLITDKGFVANANINDGYSTQNKYSRANLRTNLDIDLSENTKLKLNILGTLSESSRPGDSADLWDLIYTLPSAAFPIKTEDGLWGGNATWDGNKNPVAQATGAAYSKGHNRSLFADMTLSQNLSSILPGLSANFRLAYDNYSNIWEKHNKTYAYGSYTPVWENGVPTNGDRYTGGADSGMGTEALPNDWLRQFNFAGSFDYANSFGKHDIYSQMKWEYEYRNTYGLNTTIYRQNVNWFTHYGYDKRYYVDLFLGTSGSSLLAPGHKWSFSPTVAAAWVISEEDFMKNVEWVDFLKLRASWGIINADYLPLDGDDANVNNYWDQIYNLTGVSYQFNSGYDSSFGATEISRLATINSSHEKALKYNGGIDATLFKGLDVSIDGYYQRRKDIWVDASGAYSSVLGFGAPYENAGIVDSWGTEITLNYNTKVGDVLLNAGGSFSLNKNKIIEMMEEPRLYDNLVQTGNPLKQTYGLKAIGFFKDEADIANSPTQNFSTVRPGDIKYEDINGDRKIDENDKVAIGYSTTAPEIYYTFHLGAEWKGLGVDATFQGTGNYSAVLNTKSMFYPLVGNTTISNYYYENRWTPETPNAKFPRLSSESNANNYQTNTVFLADRSFLKLRNLEVYYKLPETWMQKTKVLGSAKVYVRGIDLFSCDKIDIVDPESYGATNPMTRSVVAGVTIGF